MIVVDTGAMVALLDGNEALHSVFRALYEENSDRWVLPSAILPEVDYLVSKHLGLKAQDSFLADLADGAFVIEWGSDEDLIHAQRIFARHKSLQIGFVDSMVIATAERLKADAIATLDLRHFSAVPIKGNPRLLPRDL